MDSLIERLRERIERGRPVDCRRRLSLARMIEVNPAATAEELVEFQRFAAQVWQTQEEGKPLSSDLRSELFQRYRKLKSPAPARDLSPMSRPSLRAAEATTRLILPEQLVELYSALSDGGFGPGYGLLSVADIADLYWRRRSDETDPPWPSGMLPLTDDDGDHDCIRLEDGIIVRCTAELPDEEQGRPSLSFNEVAPSLEAWLEAWLNGPTEEEKATFESMREAQFEAARDRWRERVEAYLDELRNKPDERVRLGFPGDDWEEELRKSLLSSS